jgi:hypothetical protein
LGCALEQNRAHPDLSGGNHVDLQVVQERVDAQPLAGDLVDPLSGFSIPTS